MTSFSLDALVQEMPKMMRMADDLHNMASYINDLRICTFVLVASSYIGGLGFLLYKFWYLPRQEKREEEMRFYQSAGHMTDPEKGFYPPAPLANNRYRPEGASYRYQAEPDHYGMHNTSEAAKLNYVDAARPRGSSPPNPEFTERAPTPNRAVNGNGNINGKVPL